MEEVIKEELTMSTVPKAVNYLIEEVAEMRAALDFIEKQLGLGVNKHRPILIERAAEILQMKVGTVRRLVNNREIPHYKREHNIYFFEYELIKWVEEVLDKNDLEKVINPQIIKTKESKPSYSYYDSEPQYSYWQIKNMWHK